MIYDTINDISADVYVGCFFCSQASPGGFFCYNKGVLMQKVSYMGNGSTTEFYFNFPYFENSNVVVTKNNQTATGYNIIGNSGGLNADIPYTGGKVVFETAPGTLDNITISRNLPLSRIADYQPLARIDPKTLNQDLNYLMEILKDQKDDLDNFSAKYADIVNQDTTQNLLSRLNTVGQQITDLGDISQIQSDISGLKNAENFTTVGKATISSMGIPNYSGDKIIMDNTSDLWQTSSSTGLLHINLMTDNNISWMTIYIGNNVDNLSFTTQINSCDRGCDILHPIKKDQQFKLLPRGANVTRCEIIPLCV